MRATTIAAGASLLLSAAIAAQAPSPAAVQTFRVDGMTIVLPPGMPVPVRDRETEQMRRYQARDAAGRQWMAVVMSRTDVLPQSRPDRTAALEALVATNVQALREGLTSGATVTREAGVAGRPGLAVGGIRASTVGASGVTQKYWIRFFVPRTGVMRYASVTVSRDGGADPYDDPSVRRMMDGVGLAPVIESRTPLRESVVEEVGVALTLPPGQPPLQRQPPTGRGPDVEYMSEGGGSDLQVAVAVTRGPPMPAATEEERRALARNMATAVRGTPRTILRSADPPGWVSSSSMVQMNLRAGPASYLMRAYVPRTGDVRLVTVSVMRLGAAPVADDPRVRALLASIRLLPRR